MKFMKNYVSSDVTVGDVIISRSNNDRWTIVQWENNTNAIEGDDGISRGSFANILNALNSGSHVLERIKPKKFNKLYEKLK